MKKRVFAFAEAFFLLLCATSVLAVGPDKQGSYDHDECWYGTHSMIFNSDASMGGSYETFGISPSKVPGNLYYNVTGHCVGSWIIVNGEYTETNYCDFTDTSGDKFFGVATRRNDEEGSWHATGGTGKYAGISTSSRWKPYSNAPQPDGKIVVCLRDRGSWKLK